MLEQFIPGSVYHVDSVASEREVVFAEAHAYGAPPLETSHQGGVFTTRTLPRDSAEVKTLLEMNRRVLDELGFLRGVTHAEFLKAHSDGKFYFLEVAARVGGAYISDVIEAATGINLWREWARLEVGAGKQPYRTAAHAATITPACSFPSLARSVPTLPPTTIPKSSIASPNTITLVSS